MELMISADDLRHRMALDPSVTENQTTLESAIIASQFALQEVLDTVFDNTDDSGIATPVTDTFLLDTNLHNEHVPADGFRLYLSRAFVVPDGFQVSFANDSPLGTPSWASVPSTDWRLDSQQGIVRVSRAYGYGWPTQAPSNSSGQVCWVQVTYNAGPTFGGADTPDWLAEAITSYSHSLFNIGQITSKQAQSIFNDIRMHSAIVLAKYVRKRAFVWDPMYGVQ